MVPWKRPWPSSNEVRERRRSFANYTVGNWMLTENMPKARQKVRTLVVVPYKDPAVCLEDPESHP